MSKNQLIGLLNGDKEIIQDLYNSSFLSIKKYVLKNSGQTEDAEDIFQESLIVLFRKARQQGFELSCALSTYTFSIARHIWLDRLRRRGKRLKVTLEESHKDESIDFIEDMQQNEKMYLFQKHFSALKYECQKLLTLFFEGNSMNEIAQVMGHKNEAYTRKRKFTCKDYLVKEIKKDLIYSELFNGTKE